MPVSGMARTKIGKGRAKGAEERELEELEEEKVPSTKPSIVPGPMDEAVVVIHLSEPRTGFSPLQAIDPGTRARVVGLAVGASLLSVAVVIEGWGRSFGVLCGALGGAVVVLGIFMKGSNKQS